MKFRILHILSLVIFTQNVQCFIKMREDGHNGEGGNDRSGQSSKPNSTPRNPKELRDLISQFPTNSSKVSFGGVPAPSNNGGLLSQQRQAIGCIDCRNIQESSACTFALAHASAKYSEDDPCCSNLCTKPSTSYKAFQFADVQGRNLSICICMQGSENNPLNSETSNSEIGTKLNRVDESQLQKFTKLETRCENKCSSVDSYGNLWEECPGTLGVRPCPMNGGGYSSWLCLADGKFQGDGPDHQNCTSKWLMELQGTLESTNAFNKLDQVEKSLPIEEPRISYSSADAVLDTTLRQLNPGGILISSGKNPAYFPHELDAIITLIGRASKTQETDLFKVESLTAKAVSTCDSVFSHTENWDKMQRPKKATRLLTTLEEIVLTLSKASYWTSQQVKNIRPEDDTYEKIYSDTGTFKISTGTIRKSSRMKKSKFLGWRPSDRVAENSALSLPDGWDSQVSGTHVLYAATKITDRNVKGVFPHTLKRSNRGDNSNEKAVINGPIMSLTVSNPDAQIMHVQFRGPGARITFQHDTPASIGQYNSIIRRKLYPGEKPKAVSATSVCVYWDTTNLEWSQAGCKLVETHATYTVCECQHLTAFAVLMDMHDYIGKDVALITLTFVLCIVSSVFLAFSIIIFVTLRTARSPRTSITIQLCICLLIGNILVISVMDRNNFNMSATVCAISAIITHYVFLCAFAWMAIEGFVVYKMLVDVFDSGTGNKALLNGVAYGVPFIFVLIFGIIHASSEDQVYGDEMYCWLNGNYIWTFIGPVILVVVGNICVMGIALRKVFQLNNSTLQIKKKAKSYKTWILGSLSLTFLLGVTWLFGALLLIKNPAVANVAAYIFTIFNASQGFFIFIFHCWMNENVRNALRRKARQSGVLSTSQSQSKTDKPTDARFSAQTASTTAASEEERFQINTECRIPTKSESSETNQRPTTSDKPSFLRFSLSNGEGSTDPAFV